MIAGPGIYWHRGAGPMPDIKGLNASIRPTGAARVSKRSPADALSTPPKANKRRTTFAKPAQICSPKQQRRGRKSTLGPAPAGPAKRPPQPHGRSERRRFRAQCMATADRGTGALSFFSELLLRMAKSSDIPHLGRQGCPPHLSAMSSQMGSHPEKVRHIRMAKMAKPSLH